MQPVTVTAPAVNDPPHAAFTSSVTNLSAAFDASTSTDADGTVVSYAWAFGDGAVGTGVSPTHAYAAAGTYPITLTVTDDDGATGTASGSVTVTAAVLAADAFARTVTNGLGSADTGGVWTTSGTASNFAVTGGVGTIRMSSASAGPAAYLNSVSSSAVDLRVTVASDKVGTGNGVYLWVIGRRTGGGDYRARVRLLSNGTVGIAISRYVSGAETLIGTEQILSGVTYTAGAQLAVRLQVEGTGTTNVRLKVWPVGGTEPAAWQRTGTDTTSALQTAGGLGLATYLSSSSTNAPVTARFDDLLASPL
jgi:PKD repeat protein